MSRRQTDADRMRELVSLAEYVLAAVRPDLPQEARKRQAARLVGEHLLRTMT